MRSCAPCKSPPARDHSSFGSSVRRPQLSFAGAGSPSIGGDGWRRRDLGSFRLIARRLLWQAALIIWT
jgi:hypothetical protein